LCYLGRRTIPFTVHGSGFMVQGQGSREQYKLIKSEPLQP
jgi:hypothetical protein